ncbi:MAG: AsmA family protein [Pelagimonas sp.]|jgi:AsmA protein|nr:AsmA family protein [Pelagimonas sp.]
MRFLIKLIVGLVVFVALLVVGVAVMPADKLGNIASGQISKQLGRDVHLGAVKVTLWPVFGVDASDVRVANADWAGDQPMFQASRASFGLDTSAALSGKIQFRSINAANPTLRLQTRADGKANWEFDALSGGSEAPAETTSSNESGSTALPTLDKLVITSGTIIIQDPSGTTRFDDADITLTWPNSDGPIQASLNAAPFGTDIQVQAFLQDPQGLLAGNDAPVQVDVTTKGGKINFTGNASTAAKVAGNLTVNLSDTARFAKSLGVDGVDIPQGFGRQINGKTKLAFAGTRLALRDASLALDTHTVTASADVNIAGKPQINATLSLPSLDLSTLTDSDDSAAPAPASSGWSRDPIDMSFLSAFDGTLSFSTGSLKAAGFSFGKTAGSVTVDNSRAVFDLRELNGYEGQLSGQFIANNRSGLSVRANMGFNNVEMKTLLKDAIDTDRFSGKANGRINLLGVGNSMAALMSSWSGEGNISAGPGVVEGIDLAAALTGRVDGGTTVFNTATASFTADKGILRNNDLQMGLPKVQAKGEGIVDLGGQRLDYLATVIAPNARDGRGASFPVRIKGPWDAISIRVDAAELLEQNLAEEKKKLEKQVNKEINKAVERELGVKVQQGENVEQAAKRQLQEELKKQEKKLEQQLQDELKKQLGGGLGSLLGGN